MNKKELKAEMARFGDTGETLAAALNMSTVTLSRKINGIADFTRTEIAKIKDRYSLSSDRLDFIFFNLKMS